MKISLSLISCSFVFFISACSKTSPKNIINTNNTISTIIPQGKIVYPVAILDAVSSINKTTSWFMTNKSFDELFNVHQSYYWGFEYTASNTLIPYNNLTTSTWNAKKTYYWNDLGTHLYTDLTGDGKKDLWAYYWKNPWPTNATGLHLFSEYEKDKNDIDIQVGLTQVRKCVLADFNNDNKKEIMLFSSGYDGPPFPGDSLGIFYVNEKRYQYLNNDIGYYHGGATGDINNDGLTDIVAYSGGSMIIPIHPTSYINKGNGNFMLTKEIFKNFNSNGTDNYYTVELFDIDNDGWLDLLLGGHEKLIVIPNINGSFDRLKGKIVQAEQAL